MKVKKTYYVLALVPVLLLSGCIGGGDKKEETKSVVPGATTTPGKPLAKGVLAVWADGSAMVTQKEFDDVLALQMQNPQLKALGDAILPMLKRNVLNSLVYSKLVGKWIETEKIDKTAEYKDKLKKGMESATQMINIDYFSKQFDVSPSEKEIKAYYEQNKNRVALVSRGGVKAVGVTFDTQAVANAFLEKAKAKGADLEKLAKSDAKLAKKFQDLFYVNEDSRQVKKPLRDKILALKKFPSVSLVKVDDKTFWVIKATEKKETKYRDYAELKDQIEDAMKKEAHGKAVMEKLEALKGEYGVKVDESSFAPKRPPMPTPAPKKAAKRAAKAA